MRGVGKFVIDGLSLAVSPKRCRIRPRLLLNTNRKSHAGFQLVPKSMTLGDLERPLRHMLHDT